MSPPFFIVDEFSDVAFSSSSPFPRPFCVGIVVDFPTIFAECVYLKFFFFPGLFTLLAQIWHLFSPLESVPTTRPPPPTVVVLPVLVSSFHTCLCSSFFSLVIVFPVFHVPIPETYSSYPKEFC